MFNCADYSRTTSASKPYCNYPLVSCYLYIRALHGLRHGDNTHNLFHRTLCKCFFVLLTNGVSLFYN